MRLKTIIIVVILFVISSVSWGQNKNRQKQNGTAKLDKSLWISKKEMKEKWNIPPQSDSQLMTVEDQKSLLATEEEMQWFEDAKLGVFIHWGPALLVTNTLSWGRLGERPAAGKQAIKGIPSDVYDSSYKAFNPVNFDAEKWVKQMKSWGAKYFTFTTKHHDGFCMFNAPNTNYNIMHTPFGRDITKELADAAHKYDIKIFWYYSQPDWINPDCLREGKHYENYLPYMKEQLTYLLTNYGKIDGIFFDGLGSKYWNWDIKTLIPMIKELQPGILINPRYGFGLKNMKLRGDYDTPEQGVGPIDNHRYWESCITITDKWLYNKNAPIKSTNNLISLVVQSVGNGGNLLLNFGPNGKGEFVAEEAKQAEGLGEWLQKYGETLYGTRRGIYISGDWGTATQKGNKLYLHFLKKFADNSEPSITLPLLPMEIKSAKGITKGFKNYKITDKGIVLYFNQKEYNQNVDNIVELKLASSPADIKRIATWEAQPLSPTSFKVSASTENQPKHTAESIFSADKSVFSEGIHVKGWWQPSKSDDKPFIQVEFNEVKKINTIYISEQIRNYTVEEFNIETQNENGKWTLAYKGSYIGNGFRIKLGDKPIKAVKLIILQNQSKHNIKISTFDIYN